MTLSLSPCIGIGRGEGKMVVRRELEAIGVPEYGEHGLLKLPTLETGIVQ